MRADGFHELATIYQTLALYDVVTVSARRAMETRIVIRTEHPRVPTDARNTVWQMTERALGAMGVTAEVEIGIEKRLPIQGGMGAGSANAAAALVGLERELGLTAAGAGGGRVLGGVERLQLAAEVGSDVPLFLVGGAVLGLGRGEQVVALPDVTLGTLRREAKASAAGVKLSTGDAVKTDSGRREDEGGAGQGRGQVWLSGGVPCVVAIPKVGVSTPIAFREWDRLVRDGSVPGLTSATEASRLNELSLATTSAFALVAQAGGQTPGPSGITPSSRVRTSRHPGPFEVQVGHEASDLAENTLLALVRTGIENDFEQVVFPFRPSLRSTKRLLMGEASGRPALYAALSGSGSAIFGLYGSVEDARAAQQRVQASGTEALLTETLPRAAYWARMFEEAD